MNSALSPSLRAQRSNPSYGIRGWMDCFVATLLAMTESSIHYSHSLDLDHPLRRGQ
jgi:hypothetical protein